MGKYILRRLTQIILTFFIFQTLLFVILTAMPGDVTNRMLTDPNIPPSVVAETRRGLGLDDPVLVQYGRWWWNFITGDTAGYDARLRSSVVGKELKKVRNIRNHRFQSTNKKRADKRASLNIQIKELEQTLKDLDMEKA